MKSVRFCNKKETAIAIILSVYVVLALNLKLAISGQISKSFKSDFSTFLSSFNSFSIEQLLMLFFCFFLIKRVEYHLTEVPFTTKKAITCHFIPAVLFSAFMIIGNIFSQDGTLTFITINRYQFFKTFFIAGGYVILFFCLIVLFYAYLDSISLTWSLASSFAVLNQFKQHFYKNPFTDSFLVLFVWSLPWIIISYPAIFMGDTLSQFAQGYNLDSFHPYVHLISEKVKLFNHHPITHTLLLHWFIVLGNAVYSYNLGVFLYALFQSLFFWGAVSYAIKVLIDECRVRMMIFPIIIYFMFHPFIQNYLVVVTKDVIYIAFFLIYLSLSYLLIKKMTLTRLQYSSWFFSMVGIMLFRNEGVYLIVPMLLWWLYVCTTRRIICTALLSVIIFFWTWNNLLLPAFYITPGSIREVLSIPFQQTARYVKYKAEKVTKKEKKDINAVLNYRRLSKVYDPRLANAVKATFKETSTAKERKQYFKTWFNMFKKEPKLYVEALLASKYEFFYPNTYCNFYSFEESHYQMQRTNTKFKEVNPNFEHPRELNSFRQQYEETRKNIFHLPVLNILLFSPTYIWATILLLFCVIKNNLKKASLLIVPFFFQLLVLLASPVNGWYSRYVCMFFAGLPFLYIFVLDLKTVEQK